MEKTTKQQHAKMVKSETKSKSKSKLKPTAVRHRTTRGRAAHRLTRTVPLSLINKFATVNGVMMMTHVSRVLAQVAIMTMLEATVQTSVILTTNRSKRTIRSFEVEDAYRRVSRGTRLYTCGHANAGRTDAPQ